MKLTAPLTVIAASMGCFEPAKVKRHTGSSKPKVSVDNQATCNDAPFDVCAGAKPGKPFCNRVVNQTDKDKDIVVGVWTYECSSGQIEYCSPPEHSTRSLSVQSGKVQSFPFCELGPDGKSFTYESLVYPAKEPSNKAATMKAAGFSGEAKAAVDGLLVEGAGLIDTSPHTASRCWQVCAAGSWGCASLNLGSGIGRDKMRELMVMVREHVEADVPSVNDINTVLGLSGTCAVSGLAKREGLTFSENKACKMEDTYGAGAEVVFRWPEDALVRVGDHGDHVTFDMPRAAHLKVADAQGKPYSSLTGDVMGTAIGPDLFVMSTANGCVSLLP